MKFNLKKGDKIFLYQFMKASSLIDDYAMIRQEIHAGRVSINDQVTLNQRAELEIGDEVRYREHHYKIVERPPIQKENIQQSESSEDKTEIRKENVRHGRIPKWKSTPLKLENKIASDLKKVSRKIHNFMEKSGITISVAESCTGGMVQSIITSFSGSSKYFQGGVVSYSNKAKENLLSVTNKTLTNYGAVSKETAVEMAKGCQKLFDTDLAVAVTGIAGPNGGTKEKPVGTVHITVFFKDQIEHRKLNLSGDRELIRKKAALELFNLIKDTLI